MPPIMLHGKGRAERWASRAATAAFRLRRARPQRLADAAFERVGIPGAEPGGGLIRASEEPHQRRLRIGRGAHGVIGQHELAEARMKGRGRRLDLTSAKPAGLGIGVGVECGEVDAPPPGQKPADDTSWL